MNSIYVILPVHNRKTTTLKCLSHLKEQGDLNNYHIVVVDDGSIDDTAQAVISQYPVVELLKGDGNLWWTGAIRLGMEYALSKGADYFIWLNDDTLPEAGAIQSLINYCRSNPKTIAAANVLDPHTYKPSYGGVICQNFKVKTVLAIEKQSTYCDGLNGNLVCLPASIISAIGYPDNALYPHYHGDTIYTHQAKCAGYQLVLRQESIAYCRNDHASISWLRSNQTFIEILKERLSIKSFHYWKAHLAYYISFLGAIGVAIYLYEAWLKLILLISIRKIFSSLIKT